MLGDKPASELGAAFIGLKATGHQQRELPALAGEPEVALDEKLEEVPVAAALVPEGCAEEFLVVLVVLLAFAPAGGEFLVAVQLLSKPLVEGRAVHPHFPELRLTAIKAGG